MVPLPKSHSQAVGLPVERSWNLTTIGEQPAVISDLKLGTGACANAYTQLSKQHSIIIALRFKMVGLVIDVLFQRDVLLGTNIVFQTLISASQATFSKPHTNKG